MLGVLTSGPVTSPAIWGKLPGHPDFVRSGMRHGESEGWLPWLNEVAQVAQDAEGRCGVGTTDPVTVPVAFALPPGVLAFSGRRFVVGVLALSVDSVGRRHPLVVYQLARRAWVLDQYRCQSEQPLDWQFWLARALALHGASAKLGRIEALASTVAALWRLHAPLGRGHLGTAKPEGGASAAGEATRSAQGVLEALAGPAWAHDAAAQFNGVRHLPWPDWPQCLVGSSPAGVFWQQDGRGAFFNAASRFAALWSTSDAY